MADAKKPGGGGDKKPAAKGSSLLEFSTEQFIFFAIICLVVFTAFGAVVKYFGFGDSLTSAVSTNSAWTSFKTWFAHFFAETVNTLTFVSIFLTMLFIMAAYYAKFKRDEYIAMAKYKSEQMLLGGKIPNGMKTSAGLPGATAAGPVLDSGLATVDSAGDNEWKQVEKYMQSNNQADWRVAIMEADILLFGMLEKIGLEGETIGEKLKSANSASFNTLDLAWSAHKVRNMIAHDGAKFELTYEDARRAIGNYRKVFEEFYFI